MICVNLLQLNRLLQCLYRIPEIIITFVCVYLCNYTYYMLLGYNEKARYMYQSQYYINGSFPSSYRIKVKIF